MCYSYEVSVITFLIGTILTAMNIYMFKSNPVYVCISIMWFAGISMQFWEALLWKNYKCKTISKIAMINNLIQPIALLTCLFIPGYIKNNNINLYLVMGVLGFYCMYMSRYFMKDYGCIKEKDGIKLKWWENVGSAIYVITMVILIKLVLPGQMSNYQVILFLSSLALGGLLGKKFRSDDPHIASIWCWVAAFMPLINNALFSNGI